LCIAFVGENGQFGLKLLVVKKKILLIEDDTHVREIIKDILESEDHDVVAAENGKVALEKLELMETMPNLILADLMMPVMDGLKFREEQLKNPQYAKINFVLMTAATSFKITVEHGTFVYVSKPIKMEDLLQIIEANI
jgi:two-component system sensor kinase